MANSKLGPTSSLDCSVSSLPLQQLPASLQQQYYFYDPAISDYFEPPEHADIPDNESSGGRGAPLSKREKLDRLFDGHRIRTPLDGFMFFLRFSLFILLINKLILITTFLIQGKLFENINWNSMSSLSVSAFIGLYFLATFFYIVMLPVPDNRCGCHVVLIVSLVGLSSSELLLNQSNDHVQLTRGLHLICCSIDAFASLHLLCLCIRILINCLSRNKKKRERQLDEEALAATKRHVQSAGGGVAVPRMPQEV